jgi:hypothetical protein
MERAIAHRENLLLPSKQKIEEWNWKLMQNCEKRWLH